MKEIVKLWTQFMTQWQADEAHKVSLPDYPNSFMKPDFYDFMDWLSKRIEL